MSFGAPGAMNVGTDQIITITCANSGIINGALVVSLDGRREGFTYKYDDEVLVNAAVDYGGVLDSRRLPKTITGTLRMSRQNDNFHAVIAALDAAFYAGQSEVPFTIQSEEASTDGVTAPAVYQLSNLKFHGYDAGAWERSEVKTSVEFTASLCVKLA